ncbi:MAG: hypothetical protein HY661_02700 [Betaproteobacteria bacterium]|nr:hypothetical protein [Betaproteobacteria bacterium]
MSGADTALDVLPVGQSPWQVTPGTVQTQASIVVSPPKQRQTRYSATTFVASQAKYFDASHGIEKWVEFFVQAFSLAAFCR